MTVLINARQPRGGLKSSGQVGGVIKTSHGPHVPLTLALLLSPPGLHLTMVGGDRIRVLRRHGVPRPAGGIAPNRVKVIRK